MQALNQPNNLTASLRISAHLAFWTAAWVASLALATFGPSALWDSNDALGWLAIAANLALGAAWIRAHIRFLRAVDELQRKILLDALGLTVGVSLVGGLACAAAANAGLVSFEPDIAFMSVLMAVVYMVSVFAGNLRYR